jgi:tRNA-intron endonuclease
MTKFLIYKVGNSFSSNTKEAADLASTSYIGEIKNGKMIYSLFEVLYLLEKNKAELLNNKNKKITFNELLRKNEKNHEIYLTFKDLKDKGHILKEGLKFGTDFRVYKKGDKPGKDHAKYLLHAISQNSKLNLKEIASKSRVAHSTNKILLLAIIDAEEDINYYEIKWNNLL